MVKADTLMIKKSTIMANGLMIKSMALVSILSKEESIMEAGSETNVKEREALSFKTAVNLKAHSKTTNLSKDSLNTRMEINTPDK